MDLKKIAGDLVGKVESLVQQQGGDIGKAGQVDTAKEKSIFTEELNKQNVNYKDVKEIWGFAKSGETKPVSAEESAPAKARSKAPAEGETIVINVNNEINWYININISVELSEELQALIDKLMKNQDANFEALINFLKEEGLKNTDVILAAIKELFNAYEASNDKDHAELMEVLNKLVEALQEANVKIENLEGMIADLVQNSFEVMEMMGVELDAIKKALEESNKKQEEQIEIMAMINEAILQLTNKFDAHSEKTVSQLNDLLGMVGKNGVTLDDILAVLKAIKADTSEGCEIGKEILATIEKNGVETTLKLADIYNQLVKNGNDNTILQKEILEILKAIKDDTGKIKEINLKILEKISNLESSMLEQATKIYNAILQQGENVDAKLDEFLKLLEQIKNNTFDDIAVSKDILMAIEKLGIDVVTGFSSVLEAINAKTDSDNVQVNVDLSGLEALLKEILEEVKNNTEVDKAGFKAILDKLTEMAENAGKVDLSTIEQLLAELKDLTKNNGEKLDGILTNQNTMIMILENFKKDIDSKMDDLVAQGKVTREQLNEILDKLTELIDKVGNGECNCDVDGATLLAKLQEIIEAIQNGSCQCDHSSDGSEDDDGDSNDESIITDLDKIFRARKKPDDPTSINDVTSSFNASKDGNFVGPDGKVYIRKNGQVFDLSGRQVNI